ncbi:MAG: hypothetical protein Q9157_000920 [Trypethelium eluteriae]
MELEMRTGEKCEADIITWRGMMTKFEALSLLPTPWGQTSRDYIENRDQQIVSNYAQYCSVVRTGIGGKMLILGGEVDGIWDAKPADPNQGINWVELKTTAKPNKSPGGMLTYERKLLKYWIQSFLLGVPKIIVGFRDRGGILVGQEELETKKIPGTVARVGQASWDGNVCINFAAAFLEHLRNTITGEGVWRIRHRHRSGPVEIFKIEESGHGGILSQQFKDWRQRTLATEVAGLL